ncbi:heat shock protein [GroE] [Thermoplasma volcanium GSS1]|uniref:Protein GrpE n=1 Tax=Thermoplasma volcanium (strain ATCC 51530 / DSM 4299 / JCM 9571 / NBRC 15438 / GSS1) TaxID=273116 RepID=GRPE_THEVO|nr:nucleotide exchange factor GrpE [Thermoplasma volcanium]Q97BG7.1 RecName: Full=Protein GrpE; AltName: Full=HSP-70 cofactor [Thermoplasma volcanium GSS1]BAB59630.1 heat shock protein [GroE] [Thermoplasma volcanium GSS1]
MYSPSSSNYIKDPISTEIIKSKTRNLKKRAEEAILYRSIAEQSSRKLAEISEAYKHKLADMENYLKIKDRETEIIRKNANESLIKDFLPVIDSMDAAIQAEKDNNLIRIRDQMLSILSKYGLQPIKAEGEKFDPYLHEAIGMTQDGEDGKIKYEVQRGYTLNNSVLRTSKVIVVKR